MSANNAFDFDKQGNLIETPADLSVRGQQSMLEKLLADTPPEAEQHAPMPAPLGVRPVPADLTLVRSRDDLLTAFGKATLNDRYLLAGESYQDMFARPAPL